ncbi:MAG: choice-of-anchor O protein, partial [Anaerolineae bacterium]
VNVSGTTVVSCDDGSSGDACVDSFPWDADADDSGYPKVTEWIQTVENLNDPSWANPYDVSKGHRGFIDGDFVMLMYATAPNWKANTVGNEAYNLYLRRSFDGGQTWTTLPASYTHIDGTTWTGDGTESCEDYGWGGQEEYEFCTTYGAGEFEQARNVSRLIGTRITVLDPRYSPTGGMLKTDYSNLLCFDDALGDWANCGYTEAPYPEEIRDPSAHFVTYETGDNTVVTVDTATVPMDVYYSRASNWGDDWDVVEFTTSSGQLVERWDWLENGPELATEASVFANPDGSKFYAVWNQELEIAYEVYADMDVEFRRIFYNLDETVDAIPSASIVYVSATVATWEEGGTILFVGTGRDNDRMGQGKGIVEYRWSIDGEFEPEKEQEMEREVEQLSADKHEVELEVLDNEGNWSQAASVEITIAETLADLERKTIYLPIVFK